MRSAGGGDGACNPTAVLASLEDGQWGMPHGSPTRGRWGRSPSLPSEGQLEVSHQFQGPTNFSISKITMDKLMLRKQEVEQKRLLELAQMQRTQLQEREHREPQDRHEEAAEDLGSTPEMLRSSPLEPQSDHDRVSTDNSQSTAEGEDVPGAVTRSTRSRSNSLKAVRSRREMGTSHLKSSSIPTVPKPITKPTDAIRQALKSFASDSWKVKVEAMQVLEDVGSQSPEAFTPPLLKATLRLLTEEVRNLRSSVARAAIAVLTNFFQHLRKNMEPELETVAKALLHKSGENAGFIREDIDRALSAMLDHVTPAKALLALIEAGASHRNGAVRRMAAQYVLACVEKLGAPRCLLHNREVTEKLLPATAHFVMDAAPLTRYYGRQVFSLLLSHSEFQRQFERCVVPTTRRNVASILEGISRKGVGEMPKESLTTSRRSRVSKGNVS